MSKILRPRRGLHSYATSQNITLAKGELFFSYQYDNYEGINRIYIGDGVHSINNTTNSLQPFIDNDDNDKLFILTLLYPVGSLYISTIDDPPLITYMRDTIVNCTWELLPEDYILKTIERGNSTTAAAGNTGSTTLTAAQSGLPAHNHAASGGAVTNASSFNTANHSSGTLTTGNNSANPTVTGGSHHHSSSNGYNFIETSASHIAGAKQFKVEASGNYTIWSENSIGLLRSPNTTDTAHSHTVSGSHTHSISVPAHAHTVPAHGHGFTQPTISNATTQNASQGHTHTAGMPQNIGVYVYKRIS